jgi:hypothetical protein
MKKSQNMLVWLNKMVLTWHFVPQFAAGAGERHSKASYLAIESKTKMI